MLRLMSGTPVVTNVTLCVCVCVCVCACGRERESLEWVLCCLDDASNVSSLSRYCVLYVRYNKIVLADKKIQVDTGVLYQKS